MQNPTFQQIGNGKYLVREADAHHFVSYHPDLVGAPLRATCSTIADKARAGERMAPIAVIPPAGAVARPEAGVKGKRGPLKNRSVSDRKMLTDLGREALGRETGGSKQDRTTQLFRGSKVWILDPSRHAP